MKILRVGLTGGIGSGKTTVANFFRKLGITIIDADLISRELTRPLTDGYHSIVNHFGTDILLTDSLEIDRAKLRKIIFKDQQAKQWLENMLFPLILTSMRKQAQALTVTPYCILVIPLLAENILDIDFLDRICVVDTPDNLRKEWAAKRDQVTTEDIEKIMTEQSSREHRISIANDIIINNHDLSALEFQVLSLHHKYLDLAKNQTSN